MVLNRGEEELDGDDGDGGVDDELEGEVYDDDAGVLIGVDSFTDDCTLGILN